LLEETVRVWVDAETVVPKVQVNAVSVVGDVLITGCGLTVRLTGTLKGEFAAEASVMTTLPA
jgi:hypothetical protein